MQKLKKWKNTGEGKYVLSVDSEGIGAIEIALGTLERKAIVDIDKEKFTIKRTGFWKTNTEVVDANGQVVINVYPKKWYANSFLVEFDDKNYKLSFRNNPLAEYVISDGENELLAYGLDAINGKVGVKISSADQAVNYLFDFLLWYWFVPVAIENTGDSSLVFMNMLSASANFS